MSTPKMMSLNDSSLRTPVPYHIPGYGGYCPQFFNKINETFGKTTHDLLTADGIARSRRPVLAPLNTKDAQRARELEKLHLAESRGVSQGDQKYDSRMTPGYTGYIPKGQHHFGERYTVYSRNAIAHMEADHLDFCAKQRNLESMIAKQSGEAYDKADVRHTIYKMPLKPIHHGKLTYFSKNQTQHSLSPYQMSIDNPAKYQVSGYTGFVQGARAHIGMGYPLATKNALINKLLNRHSEVPNKRAIQLERPIAEITETKPIYYAESGMVPHYTGHVPGEKYRYGRTFGHSTTNAIEQVKSRAAVQKCSQVAVAKK